MKDSTKLKKFNAWKADSKGNPIEGTDRILTGVSKRAVLKHIACEEKVDIQHNDMIVKLPNGDCWCVVHI